MIDVRFIGGPWHGRMCSIQRCREFMVPFRTLSRYGEWPPQPAISTVRYIRLNRTMIMDSLWRQWEAAYYAAGPQLARS